MVHPDTLTPALMTEPADLQRAASGPAAVVHAALAAAYSGDATVFEVHPGLASLGQALPKVFTAFPDFSAELKQVMVEGDRVATHWVLAGTHKGALFGIPATGKSVRFQNVNIARVEGGRIVQFNSEVGWLAVLMQLGALPLAAPPGGTSAP